VSFSVGSILDLSVAPGEFDKVLAYSVLQYLADEAEVERAFRSLAAVLPKGGAALYAANPDPDRRAGYEAVALRDKDEAERARILDTLDAALWVSPERMVELAGQAGLTARALPIHPQIWQHFYMYDLLLRRD
jgi:SAM-dependent methyltransferase